MSDSTAEGFVSSTARAQGRSWWFRALAQLGSVRMAALLIAVLAAAVAAATVYERAYGAEIARVRVYQAPWFSALWLAMAGCIAAAAAVRFPWPRRLWGFVIVHLGLVVLIAGFWLGGHDRLDGTLECAPGRESGLVALPQDLVVAIDGERRHQGLVQPLAHAGYPSLARFLAWDLWRDPAPAVQRLPAPLPVIAAGDLEVGVSAVLDTGGSALGFVPAARGVPAVGVRLLAAGPGQELAPVARGWLSPAGEGVLAEGPLTATLAQATSARAAEGFAAEAAPTATHGVLVLAHGGWRGEVAIDPAEAGAVRELAPGLAWRLDRVLARPALRDGRLEEDPAAPPAPVVQGAIGSGPAASRAWTPVTVSAWDLLGGDPALPDLRYEHPALHAGGQGQGTHLQLLLAPGPDGAPRLHARWFSRTRGRGGAAEVPSGLWRGDLVGGPGAPMRMVAELAFVPAAEPAPEPVRMQAGQQDRATRWLELTVRRGADSRRIWLPRDEVAQVEVGGATVQLAYRRAALDLRAAHGFAVKLVRFDEGRDPGGMRSASYASDVEVVPAGGATVPRRITMNEPLAWNGVTLYQSSFRPEVGADGRPTGRQVSILTAATDPGLALKYLGSALLCGGIALLYLLRKGA